MPSTPYSIVPPRRTPPMILLVEDDDTISRLITTCLVEAGFMVYRQATLSGALDFLASGFTPAAAVIDLHLPNGQGLEIPRQLLAASPEGRWTISIVTGEYDDKWAEEAYALSPRVQQYVLKGRLSYVSDDGRVSLAKLVKDAMARMTAIQKDKAAAAAAAVLAAAPTSAWKKAKARLISELSSRRSLRWLVRGLAAALVGAGAALVKWSGSHNGAPLTDILGTLLQALGGALGVYMMTPKGTKKEF